MPASRRDLTVAVVSVVLLLPTAAAGQPFVRNAVAGPSELTISGVNFGSSPVVYLDFVQTIVISATPTQIVVQVPTGFGPGTYSLIVIAGTQYALSEVTIGASGPLDAPPLDEATESKRFFSSPISMTASAFDSAASAAVPLTFVWQVEPLNNNTPDPGGRLNLLFGAGAAPPAPTGLSLNRDGTIEFPAAQIFPGTGDVTGVSPGTGLAGGGLTGDVMLQLDTAYTDGRYARPASANTFSEAQFFTGAVLASRGIAVDNAGTALTATGMGVSSAVGVNATSAGTHGVAVNGYAASPTGPTVGVGAVSESPEGTAIAAESRATTGFATGLRSTVRSPSGTAVFASATASTGDARAVWADTSAPAGMGVFARAGNGTAAARGVESHATGPGSIALWGLASSNSGLSLGLDAATSSPEGIGARGFAHANSGNTIGVQGGTRSATGTGVQGTASATTGFSRAVYGFNVSTGGVAVHGLAVAPTGNTVGVLGEVQSPSGTAGFFDNEAGGRIIAGNAGNAGLRFRVEASGDVYADGSYNCGLPSGCFNAGAGADLAERIDVSGSLEPGDVVEIDPDAPERFRRSRSPRSALVAGIVSTAPAVTLANNDLVDNDTNLRSDSRPLLALAGRVPVKVTDEGGPIAIGDLLTSSSTPGHAMRCASFSACGGAVVGKALAPLPAGTGMITALVTLQ